METKQLLLLVVMFAMGCVCGWFANQRRGNIANTLSNGFQPLRQSVQPQVQTIQEIPQERTEVDRFREFASIVKEIQNPSKQAEVPVGNLGEVQKVQIVFKPDSIKTV